MLDENEKNKLESKIARQELIDFLHNCNRLAYLWEKQEEVAIRLSTSVKSPKIKSSEEAKYQSGTKIYRSDAIELMIEEENLYAEYIKVKNKNYKITKFLQTLSAKEIDVLYYIYELGWSVNSSAKQLGITRIHAQRILAKVYRKLSKFY